MKGWFILENAGNPATTKALCPRRQSCSGHKNRARHFHPLDKTDNQDRVFTSDVVIDNMESQILKLLGQADYTPSNVPGLLNHLQLPREAQQELQQALRSLVTQGLIVRTKGNRYIQAREADLIPGVIQITRGGRGFVQPDEPGLGEISIAESATGTAMHGDRVLVRREVKPLGLRKQAAPDNSGSVVRILERGRTQFVGTLQRTRQYLHVTPDDPRLPGSILVPPPQDVGRVANPGDKVVVEILRWDSRQAPPEGEVVEVLGSPDEEGVDMLSVIRHYGLSLHFPKAVLAEANAIARSRPDNQPSAEECADRVDCRGHQVITIDPDDARDFDDAICIQPHGKDRWKLWVHIADVSHYVRPGTALDTEARKRGNSTYLVDRVIPMLPEALSNELCSLKPGLDRLTKCVEFVLSTDGRVISSKFYSAVIHSKRRFTYQEALEVLRRKPNGPIEEMLHQANDVARHIRALRFRDGSLDLDFPENKIRLDEQGRVLRIERMENDESHQLIEEFMLLANEAVAGRLMAQNIPAVYRVHESPKEKRLNDFREDVLGHRIQCGDLTHRPEVQKLLARLGTLPVGPALKIGFLKSLMRARYAVEPLGHYGLAKDKYTHFTSPIRRYADLVVHRALFEKQPLQHSQAKQIADHITTTERTSSDAERDSKEVKLYAWLKAQIASRKPQVFNALVTDLRNFGFFVDVTDLGLTGLVPLSAIPDDFFMLDAVRGQLVGRHSRRVIKMGDYVRVQVHAVDSYKKQVDFALARGQASKTSGADHRRERPQERGQERKREHEPRREQDARRDNGPKRDREDKRDQRRGKGTRDEQRPAHDKPGRGPRGAAEELRGTKPSPKGKAERQKTADVPATPARDGFWSKMMAKGKEMAKAGARKVARAAGKNRGK